VKEEGFVEKQEEDEKKVTPKVSAVPIGPKN
jgi:hypothetical protein